MTGDAATGSSARGLAPLAAFAGAPPPAPDWFAAALADAPERRFVPVSGCDIELLTWGEVGRPGLLLVHGNAAHADWWAHIAPLLAETHRVAALSLSGMGGSGWRETYDYPTFAEEMFACARAAGLYEAPTPPVFVGHSFGGSQVFYSACLHPERMAAAVLVDSSLRGMVTPALAKELAAAGLTVPPIARRTRPHRVYATLEEAVSRWIFAPPQSVDMPCVADMIARRSLKPAPLPDGAGTGWSWTHDPLLAGKTRPIDLLTLPRERMAPLVEIVGERSLIVRRRREGVSIAYIPPASRTIVIPQAQHHVMADQPLALVAALRALLSVWPA